MGDVASKAFLTRSAPGDGRATQVQRRNIFSPALQHFYQLTGKQTACNDFEKEHLELKTLELFPSQAEPMWRTICTLKVVLIIYNQDNSNLLVQNTVR